VIDGLRAINMDTQARFVEHRDMYLPIQFAQEIQTVGIDIGRQVGKTTYIAETARQHDFVIVHNSACGKHLKQNLRCEGVVMTVGLALSGGFVSWLARQAGHGSAFDVYIDDASHVPSAKLEELYRAFCYYNVSQYILLG
jgi:hypothetical protein